MTPIEWVFFIAFNIVINVVLQTIAWKIAYGLGKRGRRMSKDNRKRCWHKDEPLAQDCPHYGKGARCNMSECQRYEGESEAEEDNRPMEEVLHDFLMNE